MRRGDTYIYKSDDERSSSHQLVAVLGGYYTAANQLGTLRPIMFSPAL